MNASESAVLFSCGDDELVGVIAMPQDRAPARTGVLVVVGGPQYRVGSHRQFVLFARALAAEGFASLRFDFRGMGDASGEQRGFDAVGDEISRAIDIFVERAAGVERIVLWGLCDGATASVLQAPRDSRIAGLIMLNPWVRTDATVARTYLKHYYAKRFLSRAFWSKVAAGGVDISRSLGDLRLQVRRVLYGKASGRGETTPEANLPRRMVASIAQAGHPTAIFLSGRDYVAREFEDATAADPAFDAMCRAGQVTVTRFEDADHTFSNAAARAAVERDSLQFLHALDSVSLTAEGYQG